MKTQHSAVKNSSSMIILRNRMNNELVRGVLLDTQEIDGKSFYVINHNGRNIKLAKDGYAKVQ
jgi:hypothetical protein